MTERVPRHVQRVLDMAQHDAQLQALMPDDEVLAALAVPGRLYEEPIEIALTGYRDRPALGERDTVPITKPALPEQQHQHSSVHLLAPLRRVLPAASRHVGCDRFVAAVGREVPHITENLIHRTLADLHDIGLVGSGV
jgi:hypothetical protein